MAATAELLVRLPPDEFVAARNATAKELRAEGRRDEAAAIAAMRKPSWIDHALNRAALDDAPVVAEFVAAAAAMRDAQAGAVGSGDGPSLADAQRAFRSTQRPVVTAANDALRRAGRPADAAGVGARLLVAAASAELSAQLDAGVLGIGEGGPTTDDHGASPASSRTAANRRRKGTPEATSSAPATRKRASSPNAPPPPSSIAKAAAKRRRRVELDKAERRHDDAQLAATEAAAALEAADAAVAGAAAALAEAEQDARAAREARRAATSELRAATRKLEAARRASAVDG